MLGLVIWAFCSIIGLVLIAIFVAMVLPVITDIRLNTDRTQLIKVNMRFFGGVLDIPVTTKKSKHRKTKLKKNRKTSNGEWGKFLGNSLKALPSFINSLIEKIHIEHIDGIIRFGLPDPADTGALYGVMFPIIYSVNKSERTQFNLHPEFGRATFSGVSHIVIRFIPIALVPAITRFAWHSFIRPEMFR